MKVLVCDDHAVFREGLALVLREVDADVEIVEAADGGQAIELASEHADLDLVVMDLRMPGVDGVEGLRRFRERWPTLPVVMVSASESASDMRQVIDSGAAGFVPKSLPRSNMVSALQLVLSGGVFVPREALAAPVDDGEARRRERAAKLTGRQREVVALMAKGLTNREICGVLEIAESTVKTHVASILEILEATNRTEAAVLAREMGLKAPGEE